jgi:glycosyltransferase involved in cell wall biosynthesis
VKLAVVVQRYGAELNGGAELHARYVAEHLVPHADVEVLTTCARDYITWQNAFSEGLDEVNGVAVRRFPVARIRDPDDFGRRSEWVFHKDHSIADELKWLHSEGPTSPALIRYVRDHAEEYDYFIFFSYRYFHAYHGIRAVASRSVLVPTAERDPALGLALFGPTFRAVRAIMYNSLEERALIQRVSSNEDVPGRVVGIGSDVPSRASSRRFRQQRKFQRRFAIYVGRIDENKGCEELFDHFRRYARTSERLDLVLVGKPVMPIPSDPRIHHLGFLTDSEKFDAMVAADVLIMPSYFESLSMVTLEAWAMGIPVLVNGRCDVLRGQAVRANAGLYYTTADEFSEALQALASSRHLRHKLGANGRLYFRRHYAWPVIEKKYVEMLRQLQAEDRSGVTNRLEPLPGWLARRRRTVPPAGQVVDQLPTGPVLPDRRHE